MYLYLSFLTLLFNLILVKEKLSRLWICFRWQKVPFSQWINRTLILSLPIRLFHYYSWYEALHVLKLLNYETARWTMLNLNTAPNTIVYCDIVWCFVNLFWTWSTSQLWKFDMCGRWTTSVLSCIRSSPSCLLIGLVCPPISNGSHRAPQPGPAVLHGSSVASRGLHSVCVVRAFVVTGKLNGDSPRMALDCNTGSHGNNISS